MMHDYHSAPLHQPKSRLQNLGDAKKDNKKVDVDKTAYATLRGDLDKVHDTAKFLASENPCHYMTKTAAFNLTGVTLAHGGSDPKKD